jgi:hypothetical protein
MKQQFKMVCICKSCIYFKNLEREYATVEIAQSTFSSLPSFSWLSFGRRLVVVEGCRWLL